MNNSKRNIRILCSFLAIIAVMLMIFMFSSQQGDESSKLSGGITEFIIKLLVHDFDDLNYEDKQRILNSISFIVRKGAHFSEYAILGITIINFIHIFGIRYEKLLSWIAGTIYACTDEFHQRFVSGRGPSIRDVCIDSTGVAFGVFIVFTIICCVIFNKKRAEISDGVR